MCFHGIWLDTCTLGLLGDGLRRANITPVKAHKCARFEALCGSQTSPGFLYEDRHFCHRKPKLLAIDFEGLLRGDAFKTSKIPVDNYIVKHLKKRNEVPPFVFKILAILEARKHLNRSIVNLLMIFSITLHSTQLFLAGVDPPFKVLHLLQKHFHRPLVLSKHLFKTVGAAFCRRVFAESFKPWTHRVVGGGFLVGSTSQGECRFFRQEAPRKNFWHPIKFIQTSGAPDGSHTALTRYRKKLEMAGMRQHTSIRGSLWTTYHPPPRLRTVAHFKTIDRLRHQY
mmetsp:Transcript_18074/g.48048  ORF Transcript_18074/g.48048 Transcript_18074/m.48048 type:complete len:283 (+) Transcript_18074:294-1142(+)